MATILDENTGIEYTSFADMPQEVYEAVANLGPMIPLDFETAEMIVNSETVIIEELPFDDVYIHARHDDD